MPRPSLAAMRTSAARYLWGSMPRRPSDGALPSSLRHSAAGCTSSDRQLPIARHRPGGRGDRRFRQAGKYSRPGDALERRTGIRRRFFPRWTMIASFPRLCRESRTDRARRLPHRQSFDGEGRDAVLDWEPGIGDRSPISYLAMQWVSGGRRRGVERARLNSLGIRRDDMCAFTRRVRRDGRRPARWYFE